MNGNVRARNNLGYVEETAGSFYRAKKHLILAAKAGHKKSLDAVKDGLFMCGMITKDEYANTLRAHQQRQDEMKSDDRDKAEVQAHINNGVTRV